MNLNSSNEKDFNIVNIHKSFVPDLTLKYQRLLNDISIGLSDVCKYKNVREILNDRVIRSGDLYYFCMLDTFIVDCENKGVNIVDSINTKLIDYYKCCFS